MVKTIYLDSRFKYIFFFLIYHRVRFLYQE